MSPQRVPGVEVLWRWCTKNAIWSLRPCGHAKCKDGPTKRQESRPTEPPRTFGPR